MRKTATFIVISILLLANMMLMSCSTIGTSEDSTSGDAASNVTITNSEVSLSGVTIYDMNQKLDDDRAQDPDYVYLVFGEAVRLEGAEVTSTLSINLEDEAITEVEAGYFPIKSRLGYEVKVNSDLKYTVEIRDFDHEIALARADIAKNGNNITADFIFLATGEAEGLAYSITINVVAGRNEYENETPVTIQVGS